MATPTARKPVNIVYGVDEVPPFGVTVLSGFQHVGLISIFLVYPLLVSREGGLFRGADLRQPESDDADLGIGAMSPEYGSRHPWGARSCVRLSALQRIWSPRCWRSRWAEWRLCSV